MTRPRTFRPDREMFDRLYRGEPTFDGAPPPTGIPWDVGQAQPRLMELEALGGVTGEVLDIGCGLGDNAIFLASRGHSVTALDGSPAAIEQARHRAAEAGVGLTFGVADATAGCITASTMTGGRRTPPACTARQGPRPAGTSTAFPMATSTVSSRRGQQSPRTTCATP
jgi:SAM-dependent methyltransferase